MTPREMTRKKMTMATFALIHGSGDGGWAWHLVERALRAHGHNTVAPDLPTDREDATWDDCIDAVVAAVGSADEVVVVGHSGGGFVVPLVADRLGAQLQVYVAGLVPQPGETASEWFANVGWSKAVARCSQADGGLTGNPDPTVAFYHDVPKDLATEAMARERPIAEKLGETAWPSSTLPTMPARYIVTSEDRFIPPEVQRRVAADRLGIAEAEEIKAGHCVNLSRPLELATLLVRYLG